MPRQDAISWFQSTVSDWMLQWVRQTHTDWVWNKQDIILCGLRTFSNPLLPLLLLLLLLPLPLSRLLLGATHVPPPTYVHVDYRSAPFHFDPFLMDYSISIGHGSSFIFRGTNRVSLAGRNGSRTWGPISAAPATWNTGTSRTCRTSRTSRTTGTWLNCYSRAILRSLASERWARSTKWPIIDRPWK